MSHTCHPTARRMPDSPSAREAGPENRCRQRGVSREPATAEAATSLARFGGGAAGGSAVPSRRAPF
eukprot:15190524-Alexandrium_andersonii.AAC.1